MRRLRMLAIALPVVLMLTACGDDSGDTADDPNTDSSSSTSATPTASAGESAELADFREQVRTVSVELGNMLAEVAVNRLQFVTGRYTSCTDGAGFSYDANGRFNLPATADEVAPPLRKAMESDGWEVEQRSVPGGGDIRLVGTKDDLVATVQVFGEAPIALYNLVSPCVEVSEEQRDTLAAVKSEIILKRGS